MLKLNKEEFEELKIKYEFKILNDIEFDEINETEYVVIENNGYSGIVIGCILWTAYEVVGENETINEFEFYTH